MSQSSNTTSGQQHYAISVSVEQILKACDPIINAEVEIMNKKKLSIPDAKRKEIRDTLQEGLNEAYQKAGKALKDRSDKATADMKVGAVFPPNDCSMNLLKFVEALSKNLHNAALKGTISEELFKGIREKIQKMFTDCNEALLTEYQSLQLSYHYYPSKNWDIAKAVFLMSSHTLLSCCQIVYDGNYEIYDKYVKTHCNKILPDHMDELATNNKCNDRAKKFFDKATSFLRKGLDVKKVYDISPRLLLQIILTFGPSLFSVIKSNSKIPEIRDYEYVKEMSKKTLDPSVTQSIKSALTRLLAKDWFLALVLVAECALSYRYVSSTLAFIVKFVIDAVEIKDIVGDKTPRNPQHLVDTYFQSRPTGSPIVGMRSDALSPDEAKQLQSRESNQSRSRTPPRSRIPDFLSVFRSKQNKIARRSPSVTRLLD